MLCNQSNYNESIALIVDMDEADFKLGDLKLQLGLKLT